MQVPISLLLVLLVLAEIAMFIVVGDALGVGPTLALSFLAIAAGLLLVRRQGIAMLQHVRAALATGRGPAGPLGEPVLLAFAGLLLVVPGFLTDAIALTLLIPPVRAALWRGLRGRIRLAGLGSARSRQTRSRVVELEPKDYRLGTKNGSPPRRREGGNR